MGYYYSIDQQRREDDYWRHQTANIRCEGCRIAAFQTGGVVTTCLNYPECPEGITDTMERRRAF